MDFGDLRFGYRVMETQDYFISCVADAVIVAVEVPDFADGFVDVVGDFVEAEIGLAN